MGEIVSQATISIDFPEGSVELSRVKSFEVTDERELEVVKAVGVEGGAGFREQTGGGEIKLDVYREDGDEPEVDYRALQRERASFTVTVQDRNGAREQYLSTRVSNVGRSGDETGNHMDSVVLKFLQRVDL